MTLSWGKGLGGGGGECFQYYVTFVRDITNLGCWSSPLYFSPKKEWNKRVIVEIQTTGGTPKAGYLGVIQATAVQENRRLTTVNHG